MPSSIAEETLPSLNSPYETWIDANANLRRRAAAHGHSMKQEARAILRDAVREPTQPPGDLNSEIAALFKGIGLDQDIPELRGYRPKPATFNCVEMPQCPIRC